MASTTILMNDFSKEPEELLLAEIQATQKVFKSGHFILGPEVQTFENQWAQFCGVAGAVGVANGMDAIEIGLRSLNIGTGDEVVTTPLTAFATVLAIIRAGATPVLADIDPETGQLCLDSVSRCVSSKTKAVLLVHLYGQMLNPAPFLEFCNERNLFFLEDCAQAHGASHGGKHAGSMGAFGAYSFYPTKNLGCIGDGGCIVSQDPELLKKSSRLRNYGQSERYHHPLIGLNSRLDELQAAILIERLKWLETFTFKRRAIGGRYFDEIKNPLVQMLSKPQSPSSHVFHLFIVKSPFRDALSLHLKEQGIQTHIHYPIPVHLQESTKKAKRDPLGLTAAETFAKECLSLPIHPQLTIEEVTKVITAVNLFRAP